MSNVNSIKFVERADTAKTLSSQKTRSFDSASQAFLLSSDLFVISGTSAFLDLVD